MKHLFCTFQLKIFLPAAFILFISGCASETAEPEELTKKVYMEFEGKTYNLTMTVHPDGKAEYVRDEAYHMINDALKTTEDPFFLFTGADNIRLFRHHAGFRNEMDSIMYHNSLRAGEKSTNACNSATVRVELYRNANYQGLNAMYSPNNQLFQYPTYQEQYPYVNRWFVNGVTPPTYGFLVNQVPMNDAYSSIALRSIPEDGYPRDFVFAFYQNSNFHGAAWGGILYACVPATGLPNLNGINFETFNDWNDDISSCLGYFL